MPRPSPPPPTQLSLFDVADLADAAGVPAALEPARPAAAGPGPLRTPGPHRAAPPAPPGPSGPVGPYSPRATRELRLGEHRVAYELRRARRRSIGFTVGPEGLAVAAPRWVGLGEIEAALQAKAAWILRKLSEQSERQRRQEAARIEWRDGATLPFLGETVIVLLDPRQTGAVLREAPDTLPGVPRLVLHLGLPQQARPEQIRDAVQGWLQRQARRLFEERCAIYAERLGVRITRLALSAAATRWGSASASGAIRLNWRLVHFALPVIDYVVTHELAHLREMNHGPAFWNVVRSALPGYEAARGTLRTEVLPLFD